ncbi:hypothetical protein CLPUN_18920 [Clostridium puniceum]|uniref:Uncharacterized protein n=1 Tax=Clostridium puniceum TaxID=29367 RepID=A0A1S8TLA0_9CLOT|nr:hypothetical protein [Clostridium puniceum]OOM78530.1 hypothetical protein CLPUN_18920 [Clostridium puniceum]
MIDDSMKIDLDEINRVIEDLVIQNLINKGLGKNEIAGINEKYAKLILEYFKFIKYFQLFYIMKNLHNNN